MKKLYYIEYANDPDLSLQETIEHDFENFSLKNYKKFYIDDDNRDMILTDLESAKNWEGDELTSLTIIEYTLSEDNLVELLLGQEINSIPTNTWYYWWDQNNKELKEITLKAFA